MSKTDSKTNSCQAPHTEYFVSGRLKVVMDDGTEEEFGPGDAAVIPQAIIHGWLEMNLLLQLI